MTLVLKTNEAAQQWEKLIKGHPHAVVDTNPSYEYADGHRTGKILGTCYTVVDTRTFDKYDVKTPEMEPVITAEQLQASDEHIYITFVNAIAKPVKIEYGKIHFTVTADSAKLVKKTN